MRRSLSRRGAVAALAAAPAAVAAETARAARGKKADRSETIVRRFASASVSGGATRGGPGEYLLSLFDPGSSVTIKDRRGTLRGAYGDVWLDHFKNSVRDDDGAPWLLLAQTADGQEVAMRIRILGLAASGGAPDADVVLRIRVEDEEVLGQQGAVRPRLILSLIWIILTQT